MWLIMITDVNGRKHLVNVESMKEVVQVDENTLRLDDFIFEGTMREFLKLLPLSYPNANGPDVKIFKSAEVERN